jgi:nucleotide-binding universal stress UspA family protein
MDFIVKLTRNHSGPVWIVPEKFEPKLSSILIPLDYSPNSIRALRNADNLARQWGSPVRLFVMHVYSPPAIQAARVMRSRTDYDEDQEAFRVQALRDLMVTELGDRGKDVEILLVRKDQPGIAQYIERQVMESGIDLVVMGAKGYSRIERLVMGSVTEKWLQLNNVSATWVIK